MNGPVTPTGHSTGTSLGAGHADTRPRDGAVPPPPPGAPQAPAAAAPPATVEDDPALRIAAQLLQLKVGDQIAGVLTRPDSRGRLQILSDAGLFALVPQGDVELPPPGTPVRAEIIATGDTLRVLIRALGDPPGAAPRRATLNFLGSERLLAPPASSPRPLYAATLVPTEGRAQPLTLRIYPPEAAAPAAPVVAAHIVARQALPDGSLGLTLATADGTVLIHDGPDLPPGARVALEIIARAGGRAGLSRADVPVALPSLAGLPAVADAVLATRRSLADLEALLLRETPDLALAALLPGAAQGKAGPGHQVLAVMLLALGVRFRDLKGWLGEARTARILEAAGPGPLLRAGADFAELGRLGAEPSAQGWRPFILPFHDGNGVATAVLFHRDLYREDPPPESEGRPRPRGGARLFLSVDLSHLGQVQIDGFAWAGRLDIVLRSQQPLPEAARIALGDRYAALMAAAGLAGTLTYDQRDARLAPPQIGPIGPGGPDGGSMVSVTA